MSELLSTVSEVGRGEGVGREIHTILAAFRQSQNNEFSQALHVMESALLRWGRSNFSSDSPLQRSLVQADMIHLDYREWSKAMEGFGVEQQWQLW